MCAISFDHLNYVKTNFRLDNLADLACIQTKGCIVHSGLSQISMREPTQVTFGNRIV